MQLHGFKFESERVAFFLASASRALEGLPKVTIVPDEITFDFFVCEGCSVTKRCHKQKSSPRSGKVSGSMVRSGIVRGTAALATTGPCKADAGDAPRRISKGNAVWRRGAPASPSRVVPAPGRTDALPRRIRSEAPRLPRRGYIDRFRCRSRHRRVRPRFQGHRILKSEP